MRKWRTAGVAACLLTVAAMLWLTWPARLGGRTTYVTTHGVSMLPRFHSGDLAVLRASSNYQVGEVAGYHSVTLRTVVMHRIVAVDAQGRFTFKGDNNSWLDPDRPTRDQLVGKLTLRIPQGGQWLRRAVSPPILATGAFLIVIGAGGTAVTRQRRRRRPRVPAPRPATTRLAAEVSAWPSPTRAVVAVAAVAALTGLSAGALSLLPQQHGSAVAVSSGAPTMTFSYSAKVPPSWAYDGTVVSSPDPIFRRLTNDVDVQYDYRGKPGTISVAAQLTATNGWHASVPLAPPTTFRNGHYTGTVHLDLRALDFRAAAASHDIGMPLGDLTVAVQPTVQIGKGAPFAPSLSLALTSQQLKLAGDHSSLTVTGTGENAPGRHVSPPAAVRIAGHLVHVSELRRLAALALLVAVAAGGAAAALVRRSAPDSEAAAIRRRYASMLVPVEPVPHPPGRSLVDVPEFATLARLAERYGLLILHWTRSDVTTFVVQDESVTYRYRVVPPHQPLIPKQADETSAVG